MGFCDMFYDEEFALNLPLLIETKIKFNGISVANEPDPKQARTMLSQYCNPDEFIQHPVCVYGEENNPCHAIRFEPVTGTRPLANSGRESITHDDS